MIEVVDQTGPVLTCPDDKTVSTSDDCFAMATIDPVEAEDNCNALGDIRINSGGHGVLMSNGGSLQLPVGVHTIDYEVYDQCGNVSNCTSQITVQDNFEPIPLCESGVVVSLNSNGIGYIYAETIDNGSFDDCGIDSIAIRKLTEDCDMPDNLVYGDIVTFCCQEINNTALMVSLGVWDISGNFNQCMVPVEIQDKQAPEMTCLENQTIDCDEPVDFQNLHLSFGFPTISDNCFDMEGLKVDSVDNRNLCGVGDIVRTFNLFSGDEIIQTCVQTITATNPDPFNETDITWPQNLIVDTLCSLHSVHPDSLLARGLVDYAKPRYDDGRCNMVGYEVDDQVFDVVEGEGGCYKILRKWTIIDWCEQTDGTYTRYEHEQLIKLSNHVAPEILGNCEDVVVETASITCSEAMVMIPEMTGTDDCAPDEIDWTYSIDLESDGDTNITGTGPDASQELPIGEHSISYTLSDKCGNTDECTFDIIVLSSKGPTAICEPVVKTLIAMDLDPDEPGFDTAMVEVAVMEFDPLAKSYHPCGYDLVYSFSEDDLSFTEQTFGCTDAGVIDPISIYVTAIDEDGEAYELADGSLLQTECKTSLTILDTMTNYSCPETDGLQISGRIRTEDNIDLPNMEVYLMGADTMALTSENGVYRFEEIGEGQDLIVSPKYDYDPLNGVSTLDIILIQRHILGIEPLASSYQLIAADADNSETISASDLLDIRRLILGIQDEFTDNESWRFVDSEQIFTDGNNPWADGLDENYVLPSLEEDMWIDFVGIKVGDVNGSADMLVDGATRNNQKIAFYYQISGNEVFVYPGEEAILYGMQFDLDWASKNELVTIEADVPGFSSANYSQKEGGVVASIDIAESGIALDARKALLSLKFAEAFEGDLSLGSFANEAYLEDHLDVFTIELHKRNASAAIHNYPNPWKEETVIEFEASEEEDVQLVIFNVRGQIELRTLIHAQVGINKVKIKREMLGGPGVKNYQLISSGGINHTGKTVLIE